jgi:hypothetical protein
MHRSHGCGKDRPSCLAARYMVYSEAVITGLKIGAHVIMMMMIVAVVVVVVVVLEMRSSIFSKCFI